MGPLTCNVSHTHSAGSVGTRPGDGRNPTIPQKLAETRSAPPRSVPSAIAIIPVASPTAPPPVDPPALFDGFQGLRVRPKTSFQVLPPAANSGVLVLPIMIAPAFRNRSTTSASTSGTWSAKSGEPKVLRNPFTCVTSLIPTGTPAS